MIDAVGYIRMSSDKQEASPKQQREAITKLAAGHDYNIVKWYTDEAISGDETRKRKGFQRMHRDAFSGKFKVILCWNQDRFGRFDSQEAGYWTFPLREAGIRLHTVTDGMIDWSDFTGRVMYGLVQEGKHQFLRDLSQNSSRGLLAKAKLGVWVAGDNPPTGYVLDENRRLIVDEDRAAIVRRIFAEYLSGKSLKGITDRLNTEHIPGPTGRGWYTSTVRGILRNQCYVGTFKWPNRNSGKYTQIKERVYIEDNHPRIIDKQTFDAVQLRLVDQQARSGSNTTSKNKAFVLSGICHCRLCGSPMHGHTVSGKHYLICGGYQSKGSSFCTRNAVRQDKVLDIVLGAIENDLRDPDKVRERKKRILARMKDRKSIIDSVDLRKCYDTVCAKIEKAERNLAVLAVDMLPALQDQIRELRADRDRLQAELALSKTPNTVRIQDQQEQVDKVLGLLQDLRSTISKLDLDGVRMFLEKAVPRIDLDVEVLPGKRKRYKLLGGDIHFDENNAMSSSSPRRTLPRPAPRIGVRRFTIPTSRSSTRR